MILDTNALSGLADANADLFTKIRKEPILAIPVIVLGEYRYGIAGSKYQSKYEAWLERDLQLFLLLDVNEETTKFYASLRLRLRNAGTPIPANDCWIAAIALQHQMRLISRDPHFSRVPGLEVTGW